MAKEQSLSDILEDAYDKVEAGESAAPEEVLEIDEPSDELPPVEADDTPAETVEAAPEEKPDEPTGAKPDELEADDPPDDRPVELGPEDRAPSSWKADIAEKWKDVPQEVRAEIQRRESDYHKGIEQYKQYANIGHAAERTIAPFMANIQAAGVEPMAAIERLLVVEHQLRNGTPDIKAKMVGEILRDYGIDLASVQPSPPVPPEVLALQQQNQQLQRFQQSVIEQQNTSALSEIEQFKASPENVHFEAVKDDMAILLQSSRATSLQDAYDKAVWMRPEIRKSLVEQQRTEAEQKATTQAREKRAKAAAVGIKGQGHSRGTSIDPNASLRDTIAAAMAGDV